MKNPYLKAAELIASHRYNYACPALIEVTESSKELLLLAKYFRHGHRYDWLKISEYSSRDDDRQQRVLALLFMHWITESEK